LSTLFVDTSAFAKRYITEIGSAWTHELASALFVTALLGEPMTFICADADLLSAAAAEGFAPDNPNMHP
jgi:hypothetical protein